jgi:hypothetical protein
VAGQDQDDGLTGFNETAPSQLLKSGQRHRGSRFATDAIRANFRFGDGNLDL